jgi:hypothetical protein
MLGDAAKTQKYITMIRGKWLDINMENPNTNKKMFKVFKFIY